MPECPAVPEADRCRAQLDLRPRRSSSHRFGYRHWDKDNYVPGEECELIMDGEGLGDKPFEFTVEIANEGKNDWTEVKIGRAHV